MTKVGVYFFWATMTGEKRCKEREKERETEGPRGGLLSRRRRRRRGWRDTQKEPFLRFYYYFLAPFQNGQKKSAELREGERRRAERRVCVREKGKGKENAYERT